MGRVGLVSARYDPTDGYAVKAPHHHGMLNVYFDWCVEKRLRVARDKIGRE